MTRYDPSLPEERAVEVASLVARLRDIERRLEELTGVDRPSEPVRHDERSQARRADDRDLLVESVRHTAFELTSRRQQSALRVLLDLMPAMIWVKDTKNGILQVNQRAASLAGMSVEEIEGKPSEEVYPEEAGKFYADDLEVIHSGLPKLGIVEKIGDAGGNERWVLTDKVPVLDPAGAPIGIVVMARDITEQKRAEEAIREGEERFSAAFEYGPIGVALVSMDWRWLKVNRALCDLLGYSDAEFLTRSVEDLSHPDDRELTLENVRRVIAGEVRSLQLEKRCVNKRGDIILTLFSISLVRDAEGQPQYFVTQIQDITERKVAEEELKFSAEALRASWGEQRQLTDQLEVERSRLVAAQQVAKVGSWETDLTTMSVQWSDQTHRIYETDPQARQVTHRDFLEMIHPEDRARVDHAFLRSLEKQGPCSTEHRLLLPDGRIKFIEERWQVAFDHENRPIRAFGTSQDITERKLTDTALRQSQERLRGIFDGLGPSMFVALLTPQGILVEINRSPLDAAGLKAEDVLGRPLAETAWWSEMPESQRQLREAIELAASGKASRFDVQSKGAEGRIIDLDFSLQPLKDHRGRVAFLVPSATIITERKQAEAALRQSQKLEAVGQLAAGVAHEFNNILQTILSMTRMIRLRAVLPEVLKIATELEVQTLRGSRLTQQLLASSRYQEITKTTLDLREEVAKARELLRRLIPENIQLIVETSPSPATFEGDSGQIQQVLLNLVINARDAMPDGGILTLRVTIRDGEVCLDVEDDGTGFDEATREHLFEPFFTTKDVGKGTGLGLAVVYGIIEQHGGRIEVRSRPGEGSLFRVVMPESSGRVVAAEPLATEPAHFSGTAAVTRLILLVEDEDGVRETLAQLLTMIGYEVIAVGMAEDAMALPVTPVPDLLLSDVSLPGIGGPAMAESLLERWPSLEVTLMTGYADARTRTVSHDRGWAVLLKPFTLEQLEIHLAQTLGARAGSHPKHVLP